MGGTLSSSADVAPTSYDPTAPPSSPRSFSLRRLRLRRRGELLRIDARQGVAGRLADPGIAVFQGPLERGNSLLGLIAKPPKLDGSAPADVAIPVLEGSD